MGVVIVHKIKENGSDFFSKRDKQRYDASKDVP